MDVNDLRIATTLISFAIFSPLPGQSTLPIDGSGTTANRHAFPSAINPLSRVPCQVLEVP